MHLLLTRRTTLQSLSKPGRKPAGVGRKRTRSGVVMVPSDLKDTVFPDGNIMLSPQILADMYDRVGFSSRTRDSTLSAYWDLSCIWCYGEVHGAAFQSGED